MGRLLARVQEAAQAGGTAACPVCGGAMRAHDASVRCGDCGSRIS